MSDAATKITASAGLMIGSMQISRRSNTAKTTYDSQVIQDTLETTDGDSSSQSAAGQPQSQPASDDDSISSGDVLDISC